MKYGFNLEWNELPEELREEKIRQYIQAKGKTDCWECDGTGKIGNACCKACEGFGKVYPDQDDLREQEEAEDFIKAHFPIYF
jgi:RecJ-like exonuclease